MKKYVMYLLMLCFCLTLPVVAEDTRYNENLNMPQNVSGDGNVSPQTGGLSIEATDLTLPGLNGLNFSLSRSYSTVLAGVYNMASDATLLSKLSLNTPADWKYGLGSGWTFSFPFIYRDIDDLNDLPRMNLFWNGSVYEIDLPLSNDKDANNIKYYKVNDMRIYEDSSVTYAHDEVDASSGTLVNGGVTSKYVLVLKNGIKYYFSEAGNLMCIRAPKDTADIKQAEIWFYYKNHLITHTGDEYQANRDEAKIRLAVDSIGRRIDFIYKEGQENWLEEVRYTVNVRGQDGVKTIRYLHENLSAATVKKINELTHSLATYPATLNAGDYKFTLSGYKNVAEHYTLYEYGLYEAPFCFNPNVNTVNNFYACLEKVTANYRPNAGDPLSRNAVCFEYNKLNNSYYQYRRNFANGYMAIFKATKEYTLNKDGKKFNETTYEYYGNNYDNPANEYWTVQKTGGLTRKYVYGATRVVNDENLLKFVETTANNDTFIERVDYTYDERKTLDSKRLYRSSLLKYTEEFIYDQYNDLINHIEPNGLITATTYHPVFHTPLTVSKKGIKNGDGSTYDVDLTHTIRESDGKVLEEWSKATIRGSRKDIRVKQYTYDAYGNQVEIKDALNHTVRTYYDASNHIFPEKVEMEVTLDGQLKTVNGYKLFNTDGTVWIEADNDGYAIEHVYDELGTEIRTILPDENDFRGTDEVPGLENIGQLTGQLWQDSRLDNSDVKMEIDYDEESVLTFGEVFNGKRVKTGKFADGLGHVEKEVIYENELSEIEYSIKSMDYDSQGNMIALTDPDADRSVMGLWQTVMGQKVKVYDKTWLVSYDDLKRKARVEYPDEGIKKVKKTIAYNDRDLTVTTTNTRGFTAIEYYDIDGNLIKAVRPQVMNENNEKKDQIYEFGYNRLKQKISFKDPAGETVRYNYEERGLMTKLDYGNGADLMAYNENGNLLSKTDRNENLVTFFYDEMSRNIKQEYFTKIDRVNPYDYINLGYNGRGNLTKVTGNKLKEEMTYDSRARLMNVARTYLDAGLRTDMDNHLDWVTTATEAGQEFIFGFTYTPNNLVDTMTLPNGKAIRYHYDEDKLRLAGIDADMNGVSTPVVTGLEYNKSGQVVQMDYANNTRQLWEFDRRKRIKNIHVIKTATQADLLKLDYKLDTEGNITAINDNAFIYDETDRIIKSNIIKLGQVDYRTKVKAAFGTSAEQPVVMDKIYSEEADLNIDGKVNGFDYIKACQEWRDKYDREEFKYDHNGNRRKLIQNGKEYIYTYAGQNKLIRIDLKGKDGLLSKNREYLYDNNGNTLKRTEYNEDKSTTIYDFVYDINNRLIEVKKNTISYARYIYDNAGMRMFKDEGGKRTYYFRNGGSVNYEVEINDTLNEVNENSYIISGELIAGRITRKNAGTETIVYYHLDHLNSTKMVTNPNAEIILNYEYRAFGSELNRDGTDKNRFSYIGREFDEEINLYYLNARFYDATIGRFINVDPIMDGVNWYIYANNNPLKFKDPTGLVAPIVIAWVVANTIWDAYNCSLDANSFINNVKEKNYSGAVLDTIALAIDLYSVLNPVTPGGAGTLKQMIVKGEQTLEKNIEKTVTKTVEKVDEAKKFISMDDAVELGSKHVDGKGVMEVTGSKNYQFRNTKINENGDEITKISRFDVNPNSKHVQKDGSHLNLETQVNKKIKSNDHISIDSNTVRGGDIPSTEKKK